MLEVPTRGQALREAGHRARAFAEEVREVVGGGLSFHVGADCKDHLDLRQIVEAAEQRTDTEVVRGDVSSGESLPPRQW